MWLRNLSRDANSRGGVLSLGAVVAVAAALAMAGCSADYVENNEAPVLLVITAINQGAQLDSDVRNGEDSTFVCENEVDVEMTVQNKNPNGPTAPASTVQLDSYEVRYTRSDGRGTEGVDVPYRITGTLAASVGVGDELTIPLEVVRRQAKTRPSAHQHPTDDNSDGAGAGDLVRQDDLRKACVRYGADADRLR